MTSDDLEWFRAQSLALLDYATNQELGRPESDPVYREITEGRDFGKGYSSCGDLAHWLYFRLGVRADWLNREEHAGWKVGVNLSRLWNKCPQARPPIAGECYQPGDVLIHWEKPQGTDGHVLVVREHRGEVLHSADYGQPGGARRARHMSVTKSGVVVLGQKRLRYVLPLADVLAAAEARGELDTVKPPPVSGELVA